MEKEHVEVAVAYIVKEEHVMVFLPSREHDEEVGLRVPMGALKADETAEAAAVRIASAETGFDHLQVVRHLGDTEYDLAPYRPEVQHRHIYELHLSPGTPRRFRSIEKAAGYQRRIRRQGGTPQAARFWIPLREAHALEAGLGALIGRILIEQKVVNGSDEDEKPVSA